MKVKPAPGCEVRDPTSMMLLPPEGRDVPDDDLFWVRRVRDGDVIVEGETAEDARADEPGPAKEA